MRKGDAYGSHNAESSLAFAKARFVIALYLAIFLLGIVAGLRAFTAPAVLWIVRHGGPWAVVLAVLALLEYAGDLHPKAPSRTSAPGLIARIASGTFVGWSLAGTAGASGIGGALAGLAGALAGTYGGLALRLRTIAKFGPIPAAVLEDVVAIVVAVLCVGYVT